MTGVSYDGVQGTRSSDLGSGKVRLTHPGARTSLASHAIQSIHIHCQVRPVSQQEKIRTESVRNPNAGKSEDP
jgi:hypothetical protein